MHQRSRKLSDETAATFKDLHSSHKGATKSAAGRRQGRRIKCEVWQQLLMNKQSPFLQAQKETGHLCRRDWPRASDDLTSVCWVCLPLRWRSSKLKKQNENQNPRRIRSQVLSSNLVWAVNRWCGAGVLGKPKSADRYLRRYINLKCGFLFGLLIDTDQAVVAVKAPCS